MCGVCLSEFLCVLRWECGKLSEIARGYYGWNRGEDVGEVEGYLTLDFLVIHFSDSGFPFG